ncbi:MAG: M23 family peptidase, partial [Bdellovibrionaceae bacterium]|nr:M23 family peptidase [Pseudobdellovibrionaceae bacterium]
MSQPRKTITLYLLSNDEKQTRKMTVPLSYFKMGIFLIVFCLVTLFAGFIDYFGLLAQSVENRKLKIENVNLQKKFQVVEGKLDSLQSAMDRVSAMTNKLRLITDTHLKDRSERLSFPSQVNTTDQATEATERLSTEQFLEQDPAIGNDNPVNTMKGEVAAEKSSANYSTLIVKIDE